MIKDAVSRDAKELIVNGIDVIVQAPLPSGAASSLTMVSEMI